jgi:L-alanine-DL-glutamate epimerase-like enolase superfamily enzyme
MQAEVRDKLAGLGRVTPEVAAAKENQFIADAIRAKRPQLFAQIGVGRNALPYHREMAGIAAEFQNLTRQYDRLAEALDEVVGHDTCTDPATGKAEAVPVYAVVGPKRQEYIDQQADLVRHMTMLQRADGSPGIEGARRMEQALFETVALIKGRQAQAEEAAEAKRRAEHIARERRINRQAEAFARMKDSPA